jgi:hypothetical protein
VVARRERASPFCARVALDAPVHGRSSSSLERMPRASPLVAVVMATLSGPIKSNPSVTELPQVPWELTVCESSFSTGTTCANLHHSLKLQVKYTERRPVETDRVLFEQTISRDMAQQLYARALAVIRSFGQTALQPVQPTGEFFTVQLKLNGHVASVQFLTKTDDRAPDIKGLAELLGEITHAF